MRPAALARLARMDSAEIAWRSETAVRSAWQRIVCAIRPPHWNRARLAGRLADEPELDRVRAALDGGRWDAAHQEFQRHLASRPSPFVVGPDNRRQIAERILAAFPNAAADAAVRADRILSGEYDLLGYRGLRFTSLAAAQFAQPAHPAHPAQPAHTVLPEWHFDPVHGCRAPRTCWSAVPFLDPRCGDHKIIWELNRHQHWLVLGRAFCLTGGARYRDRCLRELATWLETNPPLVGVNWASMLELAFRSISWIWALYLFADPDRTDQDPWTIDLLLALDRQLTHVEQNLSYYFSPNTHLLGEALALYIAGRSIPELAASRRRADLGRRILVAEINRQIAPDGGHCERSTHYHRYTLDFYLFALSVARVTGDPIAVVFERAVSRLASAARLLVDDSGRAPHIGDDDGGVLLPMTGRDVDDWRDSLAIAASLTGREDVRIGPPPEEAFWICSNHLESTGHLQSPIPNPPSLHATSGALPDTGYYVGRSRAGEHLVIDGGPHGYQNAGHAHADALSLTLSLRGIPFLIDSGTACYTIDTALRDRFRGTAAHNTLLVDDRPQSVPRGPFHWARTADTTAHRWRTSGGFDYFDGSHDGYAPLTHRRRALLMHGDLLIVADYVDEARDGRDGAGATHTAAVHWHVAPAWTADPRTRSVAFTTADQRVTLHVPQGRIEHFVADEDTGLGWHSPVYGRVEPATTLRLSHEGAAPFWMASVFDLNPLDPVQDVEWLPVWAEAGAMAHAAALKVARADSTDYALFAEPTDEAGREGRVTWRVAEFETDARMLVCRVARDGTLTRIALADGSLVRGAGRRALGLAFGRIMPALLIDETSIRNFTPCAASPGL